MNQLLTPDELSKLLSCKPSTVYSWASQGRIPSFKINGLLRFDTKEIEEWINRKKEERKDKNKQFAITKNEIERDQLDLIVKDAIDSVNDSV